MLNGRMVDAYANIQTLKLFGSDEENDRYIRGGFHRFQGAVIPFTRLLTGVRASLALLSGMMIAAIAVYAVHLWLAGAVSSGAVAFTLALVLRLNMLLGRMMSAIQWRSCAISARDPEFGGELVSQPIGLTDRPAHRNAGQPAGNPLRTCDVSLRQGRRGHRTTFRSPSVRGRKSASSAVGWRKSTLVNLLLRFYDLEGGADPHRRTGVGCRPAGIAAQPIGMVSQTRAFAPVDPRQYLSGDQGRARSKLIERRGRAEAHGLYRRSAGSARPQRVRCTWASAASSFPAASATYRYRRVMLKDAPILVLDERPPALGFGSRSGDSVQSGTADAGQDGAGHRASLSTIAALDRLSSWTEPYRRGRHPCRTHRQWRLYADLWSRSRAVSSRRRGRGIRAFPRRGYNASSPCPIGRAFPATICPRPCKAGHNLRSGIERAGLMGNLRAEFFPDSDIRSVACLKGPDGVPAFDGAWFQARDGAGSAPGADAVSATFA